MAVKEETAYQLVELVGNDTRFFVTPTHRMVGADDIPVLARDLEPRQCIMCAACQFEIQDVCKFSKPEGQQVLDIRVRPDEPIVAFSAPDPIPTMGQKKPLRRGGVQRRWGRGTPSGGSPPHQYASYTLTAKSYPNLSGILLKGLLKCPELRGLLKGLRPCDGPFDAVR